jgi:hypothetical protein
MFVPRRMGSKHTPVAGRSYPPNSLCQKPLQRSCCSSASSLSARSRSLSKESRRVDSACSVNSSLPSNRPSSLCKTSTFSTHSRASTGLLGASEERFWSDARQLREELEAERSKGFWRRLFAG